MGQDLAELRQLVRQGKLVSIGSERDSFLARSDQGEPPQAGDVLPGPFLVMAVQDTTDVGWNLKVKRLVPPRWTRR